MQLLFDKDIQKGSSIDRDILITLSNKRNTNYIGANINVIYIYSLVDTKIPYPKMNGNILYIGEACRKDSTGIRFSQHISSKEFEGMNSNVNYSLHSYYWLGYKINLKIYDIGQVDTSERKNFEKQLITSHVKKYGATPLSQGTSSYKISEVNSLNISEVNELI